MNNLQKTLVYDLEIAKAEDANNGYSQSLNNVTSALKALLGAENNIVFGCNVTANGFKLTVGTGLVSSGDWIVVNPSEQNITVEAGQRIDILQATMVEEEFDEQSRTFINAIIGNKENKNVNTKLRQTLKIELKQGQGVVKAPAVDSGYIKLAELLVSNTGVTVYGVTAKSKTLSNANWTTDENSVYSLDSITENKVVDLLEQYKKALDNDIATLTLNKADKTALEQEISDRKTAVEEEATARANAITQEVSDRKSAISSVTRTEILDYSNLKKLISTETTNRINADNNKVDKVTTANVIHCTDDSGTETTKAISDFATAEALNNEIAARQYADTGKLFYVPGTNFLYCNDANGNQSQMAFSYMQSCGFPSSNYIDYTLGASGSTYVAPTNGWFFLYGILNNKNDHNPYLILRILNNGLTTETRPGLHGQGVCMGTYIPISAGQTLYIQYDCLYSSYTFRFVCANT